MLRKKNKLVTIGQLRYRKKQIDWVMDELLKGGEEESIHLSKSQLSKAQKDILKRISKEHGEKVKTGKKYTKLRRDD